MARPSSPPDKNVLIRCPRLGHEIYFDYCRRENMGLPCFKVLDCWFAYFKVEQYLRQSLTEQEWKDVFENPGMPKILSLLENVRKAQKNKKE